jgi:hypothetical protein
MGCGWPVWCPHHDDCGPPWPVPVLLAVCVRDLTATISSWDGHWSGERAHGMGSRVAGYRELMRPASAIVSAWMKCPTAVAGRLRMVDVRWG